ncbi:hypothetical protein K435DRAFT_859892 [Dendrothele bispora CBS 962.96]|uniref:Serpentine receptor class gamma n=1 Tax=Dendrothele bispora (strain CBS 962.96) TaxID=1314807 RepID=A0A4S8LZF1_DENBC|nr:hypothetical protein K435DRAFT_859892 [Dendrothele bispora CBS 962.96]
MSTFDDVLYSWLFVFNLPSTFYTLLYGVYLVLFVTSMYIMTHKKGAISRLQFTAIVALFVLATLGLILSCIYTNALIRMYVLEVPPHSEDFVLEETSNTILFGLYVLANIIADTILIHRCYKVWGAKGKIIVFPVFISIINNGLALVDFITDLVQMAHALKSINTVDDTMAKLMTFRKYTYKSFLAVNFFTNLFIPIMIAGRIWWIGHQVSKLLPSRKFNLTKHIAAVCLESGVMYPLALLPPLVLAFQPSEKPSSRVDLTPILIQVVGIAPTFIIGNEQRDQVLLSMWDANHNTDEHVQKSEERSIV